jgi:hypothetical protein
MNSLNELRYPFDSILQFIGGGFIAQRAGLHLAIALFCFIVLSTHVLLGRGTIVHRLITIFFAGTVYNNPALSIAGLRFNELAGILAALCILNGMLGGLSADVRRVGVPIMLTGLVMLAHAAYVSVLDPSVSPDLETAVLRGVLIARIFVLGVVAIGMEAFFTEREDFERLISAMVRFGVAAIFVYFIQAGVFISGTTPYGTYWDAGFTGIPSFGAVSIERGHFGKFLVLLYPFFAWVGATRRRWLPMMLFLLVTLVNFSASSMSFLAGYFAISALILHRNMLHVVRPRLIVPAVIGVCALVWKFGAQYAAVLQKIMMLGLKGDEGGGRGFSVLDAYLSAHPLGIGYSGSTLRTVGTLPQINMGAYAMASQLSFLILPIFAGFLWLTYRGIRESLGLRDRLIAGLLVSGMVMAVLIDLVDVLWFVPTIWAPMLVCNGLAQVERGARAPHPVPNVAQPAHA